MKPGIFVFIIIFLASCKGEPTNEELYKLRLIQENKTCDSLKVVARIDFVAGKIQYTQYGTTYGNRLGDYCDNEIEKRFGIKMYYSCTDDNACYNDKMNLLIGEKFGYNFVDSVNTLLVDEYKTKFPEEYKKYLQEMKEQEDL